MRALARWVFLQEHPVVSNKIICQWHHHHWLTWYPNATLTFRTTTPMMPRPNDDDDPPSPLCTNTACHHSQWITTGPPPTGTPKRQMQEDDTSHIRDGWSTSWVDVRHGLQTDPHAYEHSRVDAGTQLCQGWGWRRQMQDAMMANKDGRCKGWHQVLNGAAARMRLRDSVSLFHKSRTDFPVLF